MGNTALAQRLMLALIAQGHVLLEGLPGLAKTTAIKTLAEVTSLTFSRIQFTPDLLPADVLGTQIYDPSTGTFRTKKGPIFAHLVLADEINRAPAKVQSALLECMEERQVSLGEQTHLLEEPFLVMATQNPIEQEGTYPLPEAQIDRFLFKLELSYTSPEHEEEIIRRASLGEQPQIEKIASKHELRTMRSLVDKIYVADKIRKYIVQLVYATREPKLRGLQNIAHWVELGASPRASIFLDRAARANALMEGRTFVTPQDVKDVGLDVLRHRIKLSYEAEAENIKTDVIIKTLFERVDVP